MQPQVQKANPCLKIVFYVFNGLLGVIGGLLFIVAIAVGSGQMGWLVWLVAVAFMLLTALGIFGAHKENAIALGVFLVLMMVGAIFLFIRGIQLSLELSLLNLASQAYQDQYQYQESQYQNHPNKEMINAVAGGLRAALGISFGFSAVSVLGVILSLVLLRQIGATCRNPAAV